MCIRDSSYETREGDRRTSIELDVDEVGPSMKYATAKVQRNAKGTGNSSQGFGGNQGGGYGPAGGYGGAQGYGGARGYPQGADAQQGGSAWDAATPGAQNAFDGMPADDSDQEPPF